MPSLPMVRNARKISALAALTLLLAVSTPAATLAADTTTAKLPEQARLTLERYEKLMRAARVAARGDAAWGRGSVSVVLPDATSRHARVTVSAQVKTIGKGGAEVLLLPADQVLASVTIDGDEATLIRRSGAHFAVFEDSGEYTVSLTWLAPVMADGTSSSVLVALPPLPGASLSVSGTGAGGAQVVPALNVSRSASNLTASLPGAPAVGITWGGAAADSAVRRADYEVQTDESGNGVDVTVSYQVQVGRLPVKVEIASTAAALMDVKDGKIGLGSSVDDGSHVVTVSGRGLHTIVARYRLPIDRSAGQPQVDIPLTGVPITRVAATLPGKRSVTFDPEVPLTSVVRAGGKPTTHAVGFLPPSEKVTISWTETRAAPESKVRFNTETWQLIKLAEGVLRSRIVVSYEVIRGKLTSLPVEIPKDVVVYKVEGTAVEDWRTFAATDTEPRQVRVSITGGSGTGTVELQLERTAPQQEGSDLDVPVVRPLGAFRESGAVALLGGDKVGFAPATTTGAFVKAGQDALPVDVRKKLEDKVAQAFKHVGPPGTVASKVTAAKKEDVRFDAHVTTLYAVEERTIAGATSIVIEIKSGRLDHLMLSLPAEVAEPRITAPSLNKAELDRKAVVGEGRKGYDVRFTQGLEGAVTIQVEFELLQPKKLGKIALPDVRVHDAEVEDGLLGIGAESSIEVRAEAGKELRRMDLEELPRGLRRQSERELLYGFRYSQVPWQLGLEVKRHKTVETLNAVVTGVWLETNVLGNGHIVSRARYLIDNGDRQFLRVTLAEGTRVLAVSADGKEVKARQDDKGAIAIPLPPQKKLLVELRYELVVDKPGILASVQASAPVLDVRENALVWMVRVPGDRKIMGLDTELRKAGLGAWSAPADVVKGGLNVPVPMPDQAIERVFTHTVHDPKDEPLLIAFNHVAGEADGIAILLLLLGIAGVCVFVWVRTRGRQGGRKDLLALLVGVAFIGLKAMLWDLDGGEVTLIVLAAGAVAGAGALGRLREKAESA